MESFWVDGEWIAPYDEDDHHSELERLEYEAQLKWDYPRATDINLVPYLEELLCLARNFFHETGRHLNVYGDIGELYGAVVYGVRLNKEYAPGADGRIGDDHIEIKTISPLSICDKKAVSRAGNWNKLLLVKVDHEFEVHGYMMDRKALPGKGNKVRIKWDNGLAEARFPR